MSVEHFPITRAIADPGSVLPRRKDESIPSWSGRAVLASPWLADLLAAERERIAQAIEAERDSRERMGVNPNNWGWQNVKRTYTAAARIARNSP